MVGPRLSSPDPPDGPCLLEGRSVPGSVPCSGRARARPRELGTTRDRRTCANLRPPGRADGLATSPTTRAVTSSSVRPVVSSNDGARRPGASGECSRLRSRSSRSVCSASTVAGSTPSSAARRLARSAGSAVRNTFTAASGATTVPMSRPSATQSPGAEQPPLLSDHRLPYRGIRRGARGGLRHLGGADLGGHVVPVEEHALPDLDVARRPRSPMAPRALASPPARPSGTSPPS